MSPEKKREYLDRKNELKESKREELARKQRDYYDLNKDVISQKQKDDYKKDPKKYKDHVKKSYLKHREKRLLSAKSWRKKSSPEKRRENENRYYHKKKHDLKFRMVRALRSKFKKAVKFKRESCKDLLGCSIQDFILHLESTWQEGMTWENYGLYGWHIDHIKPVNTFNLENLEERKLCFHFSNMRALWAGDNLSRPKDGSDLNLDTTHGQVF